MIEIRKTRARIRLVVLSAVAVVGVGYGINSSLLQSKPVGADSVATFSVIGTHPEAAAQSTYQGRTIDDLAINGGKLYAGYGDYENNTGPIAIDPFDLSTNTFTGSVLSVPTEQIMTFRTINGKLYVPMIDPKVSATSKAGYASNASGTWQNYNVVSGEHFFDVTSLNGSDLWLVGATVAGGGTTYGGATAYRTTDDVNWAMVQNDPLAPGEHDGYERYYWTAALNGKVYMQEKDESAVGPLHIFDGTSWSTGTTDPVCGVFQPNQEEVFAGRIVCVGSTSGITPSTIQLYDGSHTSSVTTDAGMSIYDLYKADDGYLYALGSSKIIRSNDGTTWRTVANSPVNARSIAVYQDKIYLGTSDAKILESDTTITDMPVIKPEITSLSKTAVPIGNEQNNISIYGSNFSQGVTVDVDGENGAVSGVEPGGTRIDVILPPSMVKKTVDITVTNPDGQSSTLVGKLQYVASSSLSGGLYDWSNSLTADVARNWFRVSSSPDGSRLAATDGSEIFTSKDSGSTWIAQPTPTGCNIWGVATAPNENTLIAYGIDYLCVSHDGGATWDRKSSLGASTWMKVVFSADGSTVIALSNTGGIYASKDDGDNWTKYGISGTTSFSDAGLSSGGSTIVVGAGSGLYVSTNSGVSWTQRKTGYWSSVAVANNGMKLVASGSDGYIYTSTDSGTTWTEQSTAGKLSLGRLTISSDGQHLAGTNSTGASIYISNDGGSNWTKQKTSSTDYGWGGLAMSADGEKLVASESGGYIWQSSDGGQTWQRPVIKGGDAFATGASPDGKILVTEDSSRNVYTSSDKGVSWQKRTNPVIDPGAWYGGEVLVANNGTIVMIDNETNYISTDSGDSWMTMDANMYPLALSANGQKIIGSDWNGNYFTSTDNGTTWQSITSMPKDSLEDFSATPDLSKQIIATDNSDGIHANMYISSDSGISWSQITNTPGICYNTDISADGNTIAASCYKDENASRESLYVSANDGESWTEALKADDGNWEPLDIAADGEKIIAMNYRDDYLHISTDSGKTWATEYTAGTAALSSGSYWQEALFFDNSTRIIATYNNGPVLIGVIRETPALPSGDSQTSLPSTTQSPNAVRHSLSPYVQVREATARSEGAPSINLDNDLNFTDGSGAILNVKKGQSYSFTIKGSDGRMELCSFTINSFNKTDSDPTVTGEFKCGSDTTNITLSSGDNITRDINNDGKDDISLQAIQISLTGAQLLIKKIQNTDDKSVIPSQSATNSKDNNHKSITPWLWVAGTIPIVTLIIIAIWLVMR